MSEMDQPTQLKIVRHFIITPVHTRIKIQLLLYLYKNYFI